MDEKILHQMNKRIEYVGKATGIANDLFVKFSRLISEALGKYIEDIKQDTSLPEEEKEKFIKTAEVRSVLLIAKLRLGLTDTLIPSFDELVLEIGALSTALRSEKNEQQKYNEPSKADCVTE